jgi:hypothetical protein
VKHALSIRILRSKSFYMGDKRGDSQSVCNFPHKQTKTLETNSKMDHSGEFSDEGLDEFEESVEDPNPRKKVILSCRLYAASFAIFGFVLVVK